MAVVSIGLVLRSLGNVALGKDVATGSVLVVLSALAYSLLGVLYEVGRVCVLLLLSALAYSLLGVLYEVGRCVCAGVVVCSSLQPAGRVV